MVLKIKQAMVLAAGLGKRLHPLTLTTPKPLLPIQGRPIIATILERLRAHGVNKIVVNTHYLPEQMQDYLTKISGIKIIISYEPELLETAGAVIKVLDEFDGKPFFAINADIYWDESSPNFLLRNLEEAWDKNTMDILLALIQKSQAIGFSGAGDYHFGAGSLLRYRSAGSLAPYVFSGVRILQPRIFEGLVQGFLSQTDLFHAVELKERLHGMVHNNKWCDIGTISAYQALQEHLS